MGDTYQAGNIGAGAQVIQGQGNFLLDVKIADAADAEWLADWVREQEGARAYHGPLLPRLEPLVLSNRARELDAIGRFCEDSDDRVLYLIGLAGMGKSTVARAAIGVRSTSTPAVWVTCEGLDADRLLAELDAGLDLDVHAVLADPKAALSRKTNAVLGAIEKNSIVVLDGFEALLDDAGLVAPGVDDVMGGFMKLDHHAKVITTSRRVPSGLGKGTPGIQIYDLRGLDGDSAEELFRARAARASDNGAVDVPPEVLSELDGHPKFIELVASATAELPLDQIVKGVLTATDVGEFVVSQVLGQLDDAERVVLSSGAVFRSAFPFDALNSVVGVFETGLDLEQPVRRLVRRSIFEPVNGSGLGYFIHPLLRDAAVRPTPTETQARAHTAAAAWFLREDIDPEDFTSWDPGLYHLRRAAEIDNSEAFVDSYVDFLATHDQKLEFAGWSRRLLEEYQHLMDLAGDPESVNLAAWAVGTTLWRLDDYEQSIVVLMDLAERLRDAKAESPDDRDVAEFLAQVDLRLADSLAGQSGRVPEQEAGDTLIAEAREFLDEAEKTLESSDDLNAQVKVARTGFEIARAVDDRVEMLDRGQKMLAAAEAWRDAEPGPASEDAVAEANFSLGLVKLFEGQLEEGVQHFVNQARIKLAIGKIPGVAAGLFNLGIVLHAVATAAGEAGIETEAEVEKAGAFLLTSSQISLEIDQPAGVDDPSLLEMIQPVLANAESVQRGRMAVDGISEKLLPYYERGLARLGA